MLILSLAGPVFAYGIQTKTANCVANQALQDPACTPGAILTTDTKVICISGYTKTVRNVTTAVKKKVFKEYAIPWSLRSNYEVDHLISLEVGGSNDISNLWPESYSIKNSSLTKDTFENYLHKEVCSGRLSLPEAQREISGNWLLYYQQWKHPGSAATTAAPPVTTPVIINPVLTPPATAATVPSAGPEVKKSRTNICHEKGSRYYDTTIYFIPYNTLQECLDSGGRLPLN